MLMDEFIAQSVTRIYIINYFVSLYLLRFIMYFNDVWVLIAEMSIFKNCSFWIDGFKY